MLLLFGVFWGLQEVPSLARKPQEYYCSYCSFQLNIWFTQRTWRSSRRAALSRALFSLYAANIFHDICLGVSCLKMGTRGRPTIGQDLGLKFASFSWLVVFSCDFFGGF